MQPIDLETASLLLDFSGGDERMKPLGELQLEGAVALQNMLADPDVGVGYLADEVGMGKTYVALGVVALMRYFNPGLRVLYICPSTNVQEKWHGREHPAFIRNNFRGTNFNIRTPQGDPGMPSAFCGSIEDLISAATTGYYGDLFVRMSSFSMAMGEQEDDLAQRLRWLKERVPASLLGRSRAEKEDVKRAFAKAVNYLLPTFDLVVIDEAHNFKHDFESSARNLALSRILGFNREAGYSYQPRVRKSLLLSATPFDVNPEHLFNQLKLVGKEHLLPQGEWADQKQLKERMARFMVRRLNTLNICSKPHTRNMYRREWRKGDRAEITLPSDEHKLITALVQKHVGDMLNREGGNPAFQLGLLASFESYAQTSKTGDVAMFDGDKEKDDKSEAPDRHLIDIIRDGYVRDEAFGKTLPHPKMDQVSRDLAAQAFEEGRKQLVFVRRVKSVNELKKKLDDLYNEWLEGHLLGMLSGEGGQFAFMRAVIDAYGAARQERDDDISGGDASLSNQGEEERVLPKTDTLFNWFFRGEKPPELDGALSAAQKRWPLPDGLRKSLIAKNNANVLGFEFNWCAWVALDVLQQPMDVLMDAEGGALPAAVQETAVPVADDDNLSLFLSTQQAALRFLARKHAQLPGLAEIADYLGPMIRGGGYRLKDSTAVRKQLTTPTFFGVLAETGLEELFFSSPAGLAEKMRSTGALSYEDIHRVEVHRQLVAQSFRTGHPFIDLYVTRLMLGDADISEERRYLWLRRLCDLLGEQRQTDRFSSARELSLLNDNLDLVIKNNLPKANSKKSAELRIWLNQELPSSAPIIGANGETRGSRSLQARKFRMPGYPLVLISTDVFQEGEDLHTFCDSVVHYGLSASPVSIEQKTGRVDRVGAHAHRRLLALQGENPIDDDDYIQVRFPFVRQSIEATQVRVLCNRMNAFIGSLHEIGGHGQSMEAFVDISKELADSNEIPEQLLAFLESPFARKPSLPPNPQLRKKVQALADRHLAAHGNVSALVSRIAASALDRQNKMSVNVPGLEDRRFEVRVDSARSCGEVLLKVRDDARLDLRLLGNWTVQSIREYQGEHYRQAFARISGVLEKDGLALYRDAEVLVGDGKLTSEGDVLGLFERFLPGMAGSAFTGAGIGGIPEFSDEKCHRYLQDKFLWNGSFTSKVRKKHVEFVFHFNNDARRRHVVRAQVAGANCIFEAMVAPEDVVRHFTRDRLLDLTWLRNREIDLVEALVRPDGCLVARAVHPARAIDFEEFIFTAYVLAVEADRLEYLIKEPDEF